MSEASTTKNAAPEAPGQLVGLLAVACLALLASVVMFFVGQFVGTGAFPSSSEVATKIGLAWWSNFMLTIAVVSFAGVLVLAGVRRMLATAGFRV